MDALEKTPAPEHPASATPVQGAASTIVSQLKVQQRFVRNVGAALATIAVGGGVVLFLTRASDTPPAASSGVALPSTEAPVGAAGAPLRPLASTSAMHELPAGSATLVVPVVAVSALPAERAAPSAGSATAAPHVQATAGIAANARPRPPAAPSASAAAPQEPATTAKPTEAADPFSGRF